MAFDVMSAAKLYLNRRSTYYMKAIRESRIPMKLVVAFLSAAAVLVSVPGANKASDNCGAPDIICKAAANQDRSLYVRDRCRYEQRIRVERFKIKNGEEKLEELRETVASIEPAEKPDKTGRTPVTVRVTGDTDKKGNPKREVDENAVTLLSFGAVLDLAFFPLLPEKVKDYTFQELIAQRKNEKWYRFIPRPEVIDKPLASGVVQLDPQTGEVLTVQIEGLHNLDVLDKNARKLRSFSATIDYSQFDGVLRMPTLATGRGVSEISRFEGGFRFKFEEGRYAVVRRID
jgi:hypothetical protein